MSAYLADLQAQAAIVFTNAAGYNAAFRTYVAQWTDDFIIPIVDVNNPMDEYTFAIKESIKTNSPTNFYLSVDPNFNQLFHDYCEFAVNLVIQDTAPQVGVGRFDWKTTQTGVDAPTIAIVNNTVAAAAPVSSRVGVGEYNLTFAAGTYPDITKCQGMEAVCLAPVGNLLGMARVVVVNATVVKILTYVGTADILTGVITWAASDAILNESYLRVIRYPA